MSLWNLAKRSLSFYWRTNLGVLLAVMVSAIVLTGALVIGDSVRYSLKSMVEARLGETQLALIPNNRFFRAELANELAKELDTVAAPVLQLRGLIANSNGEKRANRIEVLGVDGRFFEIGTAQSPLGDSPNQTIVLNTPLAIKLGVAVGDEVVLRIEKPSLMPRDVPLTPDSGLSMAFRLVVKAIAGQSDFGSFSLKANQITSLNAFVSLQWLQEQLGRNNEANMLLLAANARDDITVEKANDAVKKCWKLADAGLELRRLQNKNMFELRSRRVFIDESITSAAINTGDESFSVLTYFVNELSSGDRATPYSMVAAVSHPADAGGLIPEDMRDNEILINQWLAGDLDVKEGDDIELTYFVLGSMRALREEKTSFRIKAILSMDNPAMDPNLMPDFPGLADAENCRDWDPGIPIDLDKIRKQDEDYWQEYKGTPKAFVTLRAGQKMWANRYGNLTMIRYPEAAKGSSDTIASTFLSNVSPASVGLFFQSVRSRGVKAGDQANDFGQLFLGLSMFLIIAALILMGLLFVFGIESRREQIGMLLAVGFSPKLVRRLLFIEGGILAVLGVLVGTVAGLIYTKVMIYGLATLWQAAVSGSEIYFYAKPSSLFQGALAAVAVSLFAIWLTLRKQVSRPARELLGGGLDLQFFTGKKVLKGRIGLCVAAAATVVAILLLGLMGNADSAAVAGVFFGAGALLLIAGLGLTHALLRMLASGWNNAMASLAGLGLRNTTRRSGRSLAVVGLLACGIFLVVAVGSNRHNPLVEAHKRDSGTGGFTLFGESSISILYDLSSPSGRQSMSLDDNVLEGVQIVQLRIHEGDDASCLNLNRAQMPQLLALQPNRLQERGSFAFTKTIESDNGNKLWDLLNENLGDNVVPAVGDYATMYWALGKSVGDELDYVDEKGVKFRLRLVGMLKNSILQGSLVISEDEFITRFPSEDGYRLLLIDAPNEKTEAVADLLSTRLRDYGLSVTPTTQRLAEFSAVENTYLSIFQLLGGLGLILGSLGLGLVVLRNVLERRGEFAMLQAVGFDKAALKRMVFYEHGGLMAGGLVCGIVAALVAVSPALKSPGAQIPYFSLVFTIAAITASGLLWIRVATAFALSGKMLEALRNE
ncbi:MAG: ABC transporter permease [Planctomycetes bacterium]|nr:ABC transporter permease [Planctomycetota bacterium]